MADFTPSLDGTSLASTSTAPSHGNNNCCVYDAFLNHCGPDVKKGLATHIYYRLKGLGLAVFLDQQELERGDGLNAQIEGAIRTASLQVAIFSRRYAQSNWCLDELVQMLESGSAIIPVSYKVGPADLLIILDDIDHMDQMDALCAPVKDTIDVGSLILITSRNKDVLISAGIGESSIYTLKGINPEDSQELFCWHAFGQPRPVIGFEEVVKKFLHVCNGLPLSLKVLGALLRGKDDLRHWSAQLRKTSKVLPDDIRSRLRISYDALDEEEKQIFLEVACFFIGEDRDTAIRVWDGSDWEGLMGLWKLENRCLVEVDSTNRLRMHDHLRRESRISTSSLAFHRESSS